jgi:hypothetical protein
MPAMTCPYPDCAAYAEMAMVSSLQPVGITGRGQVAYAVWSCRACGRYILGELSPSGAPLDYLPHPSGLTLGRFEHVPDTIASDARQGFLCFKVGAWRAAAAMARRALQASAYEKGAPNRKLIAQIDWLADNGIITGQMRDVAHQIRLGGNLGAHPDSDGPPMWMRTPRAASCGFSASTSPTCTRSRAKWMRFPPTPQVENEIYVARAHGIQPWPDG